MKKVFWVTIIAFLSTTLAAQTYDFGDIPDEHLQMDFYEKDSSASAVVLFEIGDALVEYRNNRFESTLKFHSRIKILADDAVDLADISISFSKRNPGQKVKNLKVSVYNSSESGELTIEEVDEKDTFEENIVDDIYEIKFLIPNVKKGSVIEYSYEIDSQFAFDFNTWIFQKEIPVIESRFNIKIPNYFRFYPDIRGYHELSFQERVRYNGNLRFRGTALGYYGYNYMFWMKDIPALKEEPYMRPNVDYLSTVSLYLNAVDFPGGYSGPIQESWSSLIEDLIDDPGFGGMLISTDLLSGEVDSLIAGLENESDKMKAIFDFVRDSISVENVYHETLDDVFKERTGNGGDKNLLLVQLLREAGLNAHPFLTSTRINGQVIPNYPDISQFNRNLAFVLFDSTYHLLDPNNSLLPYDTYSSQILGSKGLIIDKSQTIWLDIFSKRTNNELKYITATIDSNTTRYKVNSQSYGLLAYNYHRQLIDADSSSNFEKDLLVENAQLDSIQITQTELDKSFKYVADISIDNLGTDSVLYINPMVYKYIDENPFESEVRSFPVDYEYPFDESIVMNIVIPDGWNIEELPQPVLYRLPGRSGEFRRIIRADESQISMNYRFKIDKIRFMPEEYEILKGMYDQMVTSLAENIVLKKES